MIRKWFFAIDRKIIRLARKISTPLSHTVIFIIFFWFGAIKIFGISPANPLVEELLKQTLPFLTFGQFIILFGIYEIIIGISFLIPKKERLAIALLIPHMIATSLPLILLPQTTWQSFLIPTLEGQYIIKNLVIIALAIEVGGRLKPWK